MYRDVTLAPDDIEWIGVVTDAQLKDAVFNQEQFDAVVAELGVREALNQFTRLHRVIANQLIVTATTDPLSSPWARRTIVLCFRLKKRRNQIRWMLRNEIGVPATDVVLAELDAQYPRAAWGSEVENAS